MNEYELMTILHPRLNADEVSATVEVIERQITGPGGEMISTDVWGRRRLAYPIQHLLEGTYVLMTFRLDPSQTRALESWLGISESVLRHLLIRGIIPYEQADRGGSQERRAAERPAEVEAEEEAEEMPEAESQAEPGAELEEQPEAVAETEGGDTADEDSDDDVDREAAQPAATGERRTASD